MAFQESVSFLFEALELHFNVLNSGERRARLGRRLCLKGSRAGPGSVHGPMCIARAPIVSGAFLGELVGPQLYSLKEDHLRATAIGQCLR